MSKNQFNSSVNSKEMSLTSPQNTVYFLKHSLITQLLYDRIKVALHKKIQEELQNGDGISKVPVGVNYIKSDQ